MSSQIPALGKFLITDFASKWSAVGVRAKMVSKLAYFLKDMETIVKLALKELHTPLI